jgi:uncharacterized membrane protein required for colicin V production
MYLDLFITVLAALGFLQGYKKGIIYTVCNLLGYLLGAFASLYFSSKLIGWLQVNSAWAIVFAYVGLFLGTVYLTHLIGSAVTKIFETLHINFLNKLIGGLLGAFITIIALSSIMWVIQQTKFIPIEKFNSSKLANSLIAISPTIINTISILAPIFKEWFTHFKEQLEIIANQK